MKANNLAAHFRRPRMGRRLLALAISLTAMGGSVKERLSGGILPPIIRIQKSAMYPTPTILPMVPMPIRDRSQRITGMNINRLNSSSIPQLIAARTGRLSYRAVRMIWDISMLSAGFLLGSALVEGQRKFYAHLHHLTVIVPKENGYETNLILI